MTLRHTFLAFLVAAVWGINFTVIQIGLGSFPPLLLAALRFMIAAIPALFLPRPAVPWSKFVVIGATLFLGQFALLFTSMAFGMPAGLASVVLQSQAFMTILLASILLREKPTVRQIVGSLIAVGGLAIIAGTIGRTDFSATGLVLCLAAALCWAVGNISLRGAGKVDMLALVVWLSLIPPVPLLGLSMLLDGPASIISALSSVRLSGIGAVLYISILSTVLCFAIWGQLLKRYPASTVAPFSLLVPLFGAASAAIVLGERFGSTRLAGMAAVLVGLMVVITPIRFGVNLARRAGS